MKRKNPKAVPEDKSEIGPADEAALMEEIRQLRAAIRIYRELVQRLMRERDDA